MMRRSPTSTRASPAIPGRQDLLLSPVDGAVHLEDVVPFLGVADGNDQINFERELIIRQCIGRETAHLGMTLGIHRDVLNVAVGNAQFNAKIFRRADLEQHVAELHLRAQLVFQIAFQHDPCFRRPDHGTLDLIPQECGFGAGGFGFEPGDLGIGCLVFT